MDFKLAKVEQTLASLEKASLDCCVELTERYSAGFTPERHVAESFFEECEGLHFTPFLPTDRWGEVDERRVFDIPVTVPWDMDGKPVYLRLTTGREERYTAFNPQFLAYVDGELRQGMDIKHTLLCLCEHARGGQEIKVRLHAHAGVEPGLMELRTELLTRHQEVVQLAYAFRTAYQAMLLPKALPGEQAELTEALLCVANAIHFGAAFREEFFDSVKAASQLLEDLVYSRPWGEGAARVLCVGHTHIDVAWRWTVEQTRQKAQRSFATVAALMKRYPDYKFMSSQPVLYQFVKEDNPKLYAKIKELAALGRWEAEGGMWLEPDCNLPSGESLVRQIYYGKKFLREEFGVESKILWLPDSFGYCAALPQLMKKSGLEYFVTSKLSWNEFNRVPHDVFKWVGMDGSAVTGYMITSPDDTGLPNTPDFSTYNATLQPKNVLGTWERMTDKDVTQRVMMTYGFGDGGGGPTEEMLESAGYMMKGLPGMPQVSLGHAKEFFDDFSRNHRTLPSHHGELYLEFHRGVYTSVARTKKNNQDAENKMRVAELMSAFAKDTDASWREELWKIIMLHQFHDVLPGSAIQEVYQQAEKDYEACFAACDARIAQALKRIAKPGEQEKSLCVINTFGREVSQVLLVNGIPGKTVISDGQAAPSQTLADGRCAIYLKDLPAAGYQLYSLIEAEPQGKVSEMTADTGLLENDFFQIRINENGELTSVYNKRRKRQVLREGECGNALRLYEDRPASCDAWNIDINYVEKEYPLGGDIEIEVAELGPVCAAVRITKAFLSSRITQVVRIFKDIARIDFETTVDWQESQTLLKAEFPVDIHGDYAECGVQYGSVRRSTHSDTSWEEARFEFCAHDYVDISEYDYGVSLFTGEKYGADVMNGNLRLTLLKGPIDPWEGADKGVHTFTYSLYPHEGDAAGGDVYGRSVVKKCVAGFVTEGFAPSRHSFVSCQDINISIEAVKPAEDGNGFILRACERFNRRCETRLVFEKQVCSASECDLLENNTGTLEFENNYVVCEFRPFEIKTLRVSFK